MTILKDNSTNISGCTVQTVSNNTLSSYTSAPLNHNHNRSVGVVGSSNGQISNSFPKIPEIEAINDRLERIEKQLAILTPDLVKLEKFAALKQAYDNYVLVENLCKDQK